MRFLQWINHPRERWTLPSSVIFLGKQAREFGEKRCGRQHSFLCHTEKDYCYWQTYDVLFYFSLCLSPFSVTWRISYFKLLLVFCIQCSKSLFKRTYIVPLCHDIICIYAQIQYICMSLCVVPSSSTLRSSWRLSELRHQLFCHSLCCLLFIHFHRSLLRQAVKLSL